MTALCFLALVLSGSACAFLGLCMLRATFPRRPKSLGHIELEGGK